MWLQIGRSGSRPHVRVITLPDISNVSLQHLFGVRMQNRKGIGKTEPTGGDSSWSSQLSKESTLRRQATCDLSHGRTWRCTRYCPHFQPHDYNNWRKGLPVLSRFNGSVRAALADAFPEFQAKHREVLCSFAQDMGFDPLRPQNWRNVQPKQITERKVLYSCPSPN